MLLVWVVVTVEESMVDRLLRTGEESILLGVVRLDDLFCRGKDWSCGHFTLILNVWFCSLMRYSGISGFCRLLEINWYTIWVSYFHLRFDVFLYGFKSNFKMRIPKALWTFTILWWASGTNFRASRWLSFLNPFSRWFNASFRTSIRFDIEIRCHLCQFLC